MFRRQRKQVLALIPGDEVWAGLWYRKKFRRQILAREATAFGPMTDKPGFEKGERRHALKIPARRAESFVCGLKTTPAHHR
jgi:hypothetical protein